MVVIEKNEATCFLNIFWSYSTPCVPIPSPPAECLYVEELSIWCCVPWEKSMHKPYYDFVLLQTHHFGWKRNRELQNSKSSTDDIRKLILQAAAARLRQHLYECQALQMRGKEQMAWHSRETARKTSRKMGGRSLVQSGRTFGTLGISACSKQRRKSVTGVCYPVSHWAAQAALSQLQLATSKLTQHQAEKQVLIRQTRGKELDCACLCGEWWRHLNYPFPGLSFKCTSYHNVINL